MRLERETMTQPEGAVRADRELLDHLREKVATACRILAQHAIVKGSMGHVSTRVPGTNDILVRGRPPVDKGLRFADPSCVIRVGPDARPVGPTGGVKRISEIYLHTEVYNRRPEVNAVIHAHAPWSRLCTICNIPLRTIFFEANPIRIVEEGLPIFERSITLHTLEETQPMMQVMGDHDVCLLSRHGVVVAGDSVEDAVHRLIELEHVARNNYLAALTGDVGEIPAEDKAEWRRRALHTAERHAAGLPDELHPGGSDDDGRTGRDSPWTYYVALLESGALFVNDSGLPGA
jgi:ribulose-5-phosphate 4-epimerase/fuculose-1-phosphate aldolase